MTYKFSKYKETSNVSTTIFSQLGGNKFKAMTGAKNFSSSDNSLDFWLPKALNKIKLVSVVLTPNDTYDIIYYSYNTKTYDIKIVKKSENLHAEDLQKDFTENTGLHTKL